MHTVSAVGVISVTPFGIGVAYLLRRSCELSLTSYKCVRRVACDSGFSLGFELRFYSSGRFYRLKSALFCRSGKLLIFEQLVVFSYFEIIWRVSYFCRHLTRVADFADQRLFWRFFAAGFVSWALLGFQFCTSRVLLDFHQSLILSLSGTVFFFGPYLRLFWFYLSRFVCTDWRFSC